MMPPLRFLALACLLLTSTLRGLTPYDLTAESLTDPLGLDSAPKLSWKLRSDTRGDLQTAWQVRAASSLARLAAGDADLWDSGKQENANQIFVNYGGKPLTTGQQVFWQVRTWDATGAEGPWSEPATWTMGVLKRADWQANWIASPAWLAEDRAHLGYRSLPAADVHTTKWVALDLGRVYPIDEIVLHGLRHTVTERLGMPVKYVLEIATKPDFSDATIVADTREKPYNIWISKHPYPVNQVKARYVRVTAPELREMNGEICLAYSQIEVKAGGKNVALGATPSASDSLEQGPWSLAAINDGKGLPDAFPIANETVIARKEFAVQPTLHRAVVFVSGQGQYVLSMNGRRVGEKVITPGWTTPEKTLLYDTYDVTELLQPGANAVGITLAGGMFNVGNPDGRYSKLVSKFRPLQAIVQLQLTYTDGRTETVVSDGSWQVRRGPTTYSHMYGGEIFDARERLPGWTQPGFTPDASWVAAVETDGPGGRLRGASFAAPAIEVIETLRPKAQHTVEPGKVVYDLGQNAALMVRVTVKGPRGSMVRIEPSELLHSDGRIDPASTRGKGLASWDYVLAGTGQAETWQNEFFYHGGRYLQVTTNAAEAGGPLPEVIAIEGLVVHGTAEPVGSFATSSELWTRTRELIRWAQRSNMMSVLTDCPHRERLGWLEQYHLNGPALRYEFNLNPLYRKTLNDMADAQTNAGLIPSVVPEYVVFTGDFRDSPEWGGALILSAWQQFLFTGDEAAFRAQYNAMQAYIEYLQSKADGYILDHGLGDWYDIGPNPPGFAQLTPRSLTATAIYYELCREMSKIAEKRFRVGEAQAYAERAEAIKAAFNAKFFNAAEGTYSTNSQTANAMPYALGLVPEGREADVLKAIVASVKAADYAVTAGDVGHRYLLLALSKGNRADVIARMHHQSDKPGYGWQLAKGKTSLTEAWDGGSGQNHFMLGHINEWFYAGLAGIQPDPTAPGFRNVLIAPEFPAEVNWVEATHDSPYGPIHSRWERNGKALRVELSIPPGATATVTLPISAKNLREGGAPVAQAPHVSITREDAGQTVLQIASGTYTFTSR